MGVNFLQNPNSADLNSILVYRNVNNQIGVNIPNEIAEKASVSVYNAVGLKLESKLLTNTTTVFQKIFPSGVYLVSVISNGKKTTQKVVIN